MASYQHTRDEMKANYEQQIQQLKARETKLRDKVRTLKEKLAWQEEASHHKLKKVKIEMKQQLNTSN